MPRKEKLKNKDDVIELLTPVISKKLELPEAVSKISAGFPSPAEDYIDRRLDLNEYLIQHPAATFFVRVTGESMIHAGINSGDLLIVDRALTPKNNSIVLAVLDGEFTVKRLTYRKDKVFLVPENDTYNDIEITGEMQFEVWGVVTNVIHKVC